MGAEFSTFTTQAKKEELNKIFNDHVEQCFYDLGHAGYTGSMAECDGWTLSSKVFVSSEDAEEWLINKAEKWGPAIAVRIQPEQEYPYWLFGAWCSS
jgi:hypothetical protein